MLSRNKKIIDALHPSIRPAVTEAVDKADQELKGSAKIVLVQGTRTFPEQEALYAQGRTNKKLPKVTNAKAGQSYHNYGLAVDFCLQLNGKDISWDTVKDWDGDGVPDWNEVVRIFESYGFFWGKAFNDLPHLEKRFGIHWKEMLLRYNSGKFIPGTKFIIL